MAIFHITTSSGRFVNGGSTAAFGGPPGNPGDDTPAADTLIVDQNAFLISIGATGYDGAWLANTGVWTVTVNGSVFSQTHDGIGLESNFANPAAVSTITIGPEGEVIGVYGIAFATTTVIIKNSGVVQGTAGEAIFGIAATTTLTNSGGLIGGIDLEGGTSSKVKNSGTITGHVQFGFGNDTLTNSGVIDGVVTLGNGADTFTNSGVVIGSIDLGAGDDKFFGGSSSESLKDDAGTDTIKLGGGNDTYIVTGEIGIDGNDTLDGGAGSDLYDAGASTTGVNINLDVIAHNFALLNASGGNVAAKVAISVTGVTSNTDSLTGFENVLGGPEDDIIYGSAVANILSGGDGNDSLFGFAGNDGLVGGKGHDGLVGGAGKDILTGGADEDVFFFISIKDSGITKATRDVIADFEDGLITPEKINLSLIDADTTTPGDQPFTYINGDNLVTPAKNFSGIAGELRSYWNNEGQIIEGDINGNKLPDFSIQLMDPNHTIHLTVVDFIL